MNLTDKKYKDCNSEKEESLGENIFQQGEKYITLCCVSDKKNKNMPLNTAVELIKLINDDNYKVVLAGEGKESYEYSKRLEKSGVEFVNLVGKASESELSKILKDSQCLISVDTDIMHFGYTRGVPTVCVFYEKKTLKSQAPNPELYNVITVSLNQTAVNIYNSCKILLDNSDNKKVSVVIPTLQKNTELLVNLLEILEHDDAVDEIILIDNSKKGLKYTNSKLKIIIPDENMFVNPSWNYGANIARNNIVALLNDDITISPNFCTRVVEKMNYKMGGVGACKDFLQETTDIEYKIDDSQNLELTPIDLITHHWGVAMFFYKSSYMYIPDEIKIFRGDDWLFYENKSAGRQNYYIEGQTVYHYGSLTSSSKALKPIGKKDRYFYRKYTKKWYQHYFDFEQLFDGYRITFFGWKIIIRTKH